MLTKEQKIDRHIRANGRVVTMLLVMAVVGYIIVFTPFIPNIAMTVSNVAQVGSALP